ncbi:membrane protein [Clostridiisalibacter paucivorans]|uniref:membrane protein n=1 Tax=Clostridiisalibacter paucivorans TaxID=408753 RepID=UPI00047B3EB4|nr:membrane protein [Clostridiisalibacter paucivorans]
MSIIMAFCIILVVLAVGDVISAKTKAFIPSVFVSAVLFLLGFWTIFPKDLVDISSLGMPMALLAMYLLITHMGTMMSISELLGQWKTISISLIGIIGLCITTLTIGRLLFGWETVVAATPPLSGGIVAAIMMSDAAAAKGLEDLGVLAIVMYVMQGFAGYPLTAYCLKKEGKRLLKIFRSGNAQTVTQSKSEEVVETKSKFKIFPPLPQKYQTIYMYLAKLGLVAWAAVSFASVTNEVVSKYVVCLIFGVIASEIGFLERKPLNLSGSFGWLMTSLMAYIFAQLAKATPSMLAEIVLPLLGIIILGVTGMAIFSMLAGKKMGYSKEMAFATALTALYGFPPNYVLTEEASKALAETDEEREYLMDQMLPKMLVGGFTSVTIVSVVIAGIFVKML